MLMRTFKARLSKIRKNLSDLFEKNNFPDPGGQRGLPDGGAGHGEGEQPGGEEIREPEGLVQHSAGDGQGEQEETNEVNRRILDKEDIQPSWEC